MTRVVAANTWPRHASGRTLTVVVLAWFLLIPSTHTENELYEHRNVQSSSADNPKLAIAVTSNPEARIPAVLPTQSSTGHGGGHVEFPGKIVNRRFATVRLDAELVANLPRSVTLLFYLLLLKGAPEEFRVLCIAVTEAPMGITAATAGFICFCGASRSPLLAAAAPRTTQENVTVTHKSRRANG